MVTGVRAGGRAGGWVGHGHSFDLGKLTARYMQRVPQHAESPQVLRRTAHGTRIQSGRPDGGWLHLGRARVWQLCRCVPVASGHWLAVRSMVRDHPSGPRVAIASQTLTTEPCNQSPTACSPPSVSHVHAFNVCMPSTANGHHY